MSEEAAPVKRGPGRPKMAKPEVSEATPKVRHQGKAKPNWEELDPNRDDSPDQFKIPREMWPEGFALQWIRESLLGQPDPQNVTKFHSGGWTPVHQEDFDGRFDGMFMPKGRDSYIAIGGMSLVYRPIELTEKSRRIEQRRAREQIDIKERALRGGDLPGVTLDPQDKSAVSSNRINRSYERIAVPED